MQENRNFVKHCVSDKGTVGLAVDTEGYLWRDGQKFDFNQEYRGFYPSCHFTAVAWTGGGFLAAGMAENKTVAYSSLRGGVWQPENLTALTPDGPVVPVQPVWDICQDEVSGQTFLLGGKGQVITLTGCPKCVKISFFTGEDIVKGEVNGEYLRLTLADGSQTDIHLHAAMQLHLSREAAQEKLRQGALLVDVSGGDGEETEEQNETAEDAGEQSAAETGTNAGAESGTADMEIWTDALENCIRLALTELNSFLRQQKKEQALVFVCPSGVRAEGAAKSARAQGFREAYYTESGV